MDRVGMWLVGNCDGPISDDMLKVEAADLLYHNGITNLIQTPFGRQVVNDFGYTVQNSSLAHCNLIVVNPTVTGGRSDQSDGTPSDTEDCILRVFDLNGRFVASKAWNGNPAVVDTRKLTDEYAHLPSGIYLLQIASKTGAKTTKIFID
jgi:hypothetical protein